MMDYAWFLFSFEGRINRARYFLAGPIIGCGILFLAIVVFCIAKIFGSAPLSLGLKTDDIFGLVDPETFRSLSSTETVPLLFKVVGMPLFAWAYLAASVKRLHDRDRSGWWMVPFFVVPGLYSQFEHRLADSIPVVVISIAAVVLQLWGTIEMFFRKGTAGANRFGPDPLAPATPIDTRPGWDQHSELEFVPHSAGPSPGPHVNRRP
jgi:uncharacterized membrane protein YhaH (DUF805 family)